MHVELSIFWTIFCNVTGWAAIQIGLAWIFTRLPARWFAPPGILGWEHNGDVYQRAFRIKKWKKLLPDGASWFEGGFAKRRLSGSERAYLQRFLQETWRGEMCHWTVLAWTPLFFTWNPLWGDCVVVAYAIVSNIPCILVQRYNRARLARLISLRERAHATVPR
ncbi:hypothetical protein [Roseimicrobium gellanilyticum]|uniref:glycosyl-4,4'-diaponeurosporenoate acyltransferase CrtO family protein n=1 Tax=Roseimicrobium gellanilyticum TaxID=748857 RepID=UPI003CCC5E5E